MNKYKDLCKPKCIITLLIKRTAYKKSQLSILSKCKTKKCRIYYAIVLIMHHVPVQSHQNMTIFQHSQIWQCNE